MSTQRYISTSFWDDEWIQTLDPSEKLLYLYYMTNPLTNIAGIYKVTERRVSFDTGFTSSTIQHIMAKFEKAGKVFRHGEWIILPTWAKHQKVSERDNNRKGIDAILKSLPDDVFQYAVEKGYKYIYLNELGRALQGASTTSNYSNLNLDIESDIEPNIITAPDKPATLQKPKVLCSSEAYILASLLSELHIQNIDKGVKPITPKQNQAWAEDIDKLNRIDGRPFQDIEKAIRWIKTPGCFWAPNIMSGAKLREKFPKIWPQVIQVQKPGYSKPLPVQTRTAFLDMED